jgi:type IV pilus assembly protein PilB
METQTKSDVPIIEYLNELLANGIQVGASDIHFEPYETHFRIRYRQDGILYEIERPPLHLAPRLCTRIKILAKLDISERRMPQDGRFQIQLSELINTSVRSTQASLWAIPDQDTIDCRVSTCPTLFGEKIVIRLLDPKQTALDLDTLGFTTEQKNIFLKSIHQPQGLILVTGPTGSGKTVSLYTALTLLNTPAVNISTCEDPIEIRLPGVNQVQVNLKAGLSFATLLRSFLRQDPDILMIGEMRDLETASIAVQAAETGHLVLSTLHANSAAESLLRLINMGIPAYHIAHTVSLIIAQRLVRCLCTYGCHKGCQHCQKGYQGRVGIYECLLITPEISQLLLNNASAADIQKLACEQGMWTLRMSGSHLIHQGITDQIEIDRVTRLDNTPQFIE